MNKEELKEAIQKIADEKDIDLKASWYNLGVDKMQAYYTELKGEKVTLPVVELVKEASIEKSVTNPFGEEIIKIHVPMDKANPKIKNFTFSINGKRLMFPLGKMAHMPKSYYEGYLNSQDTEMQAQIKLSENHFKEI
ncbi:MAG: hypothetical protein GY787_08685 [Alteromonadales bacterium]|nr:hypothetical protein [Alteromonadales bacterium]